jgi:pimeloyl-ACP methyl ester carboxylesterase
MRRHVIMRPDDAATSDPPRRWRFRLLASIGGSVFGLVTSLYSAEFRRLLETPFRVAGPDSLPFVLTAAAASVSSVLIYEIAHRRRQPGEVTPGKLTIRSDVLDRIPEEEEPVVGRSLRYLETRRYSGDLVVFLHGLGLDANDFRPYLSESRYHCLALTLYGFNAIERDNPHYRPISLESQVRLVGYALRKLQRSYPRKRITMVGFSFGADIILMLPELDPDALADLRLRKAVLLDPNVNNTTTTISSRIAEVGSDRSLRDLVGILRSARTASEFRYLCEYLSKISSKNFAQVRRLAQDMVVRYRQRSFGPFLDAVGHLDSGTEEGVYVVLSLNHEEIFNAVVRAAAARGLDVNRLECSRTDHFDLIGPGFLKGQLEQLLG